ncbi:cytochrome P450 18a1-like [Paramacrobiotus metropolitanus]|uniref:cytochrome P450 18a1-like n=1 Tax=Paramacrobiotus metropolitanus TaxID=2943436 RepID=UPI00244649E1|nr:cytochrome P450 18a1-like [Paramacrobiotus metropolitanus]
MVRKIDFTPTYLPNFNKRQIYRKPIYRLIVKKMLTLFLCFIGALAFVIIWNSLQKRKHLPPGPVWEWPILGSAMDLGRLPHITLMKMAQQYGRVFRLHMGLDLAVVLNDYESIKKAFNLEESTGRPRDTIADYLFGRNVGLAFSEGSLWKEHRRFALSALRDLGMGKSWLQEQILDETELLIQALTAAKEQPIDPHHLVTTTVSNVICAAAFGKRYAYTDERFRSILRNEQDFIQQLNQMSPLDLFPVLRFVPPFREVFQKRLDVVRTRYAHIAQAIRDAKISGVEDADRKDYVNLYLREQKRQFGHDSMSTFSDGQLVDSVIDIFGGGTHTAVTSILFGMILLVENPEVLKRVHTELDAVAKPNEPILLEHKGHVPFTEATILEVQRLIPVVPLGVLHRTTAPTNLDGYELPPNTLLMSNIYAVHHDPQLWDEPEVFSPSRFLDNQGKFVKSPHVIHFSLGKRACPGEGLALMELFLVFANLIHKFDLETPEGSTVSSKDVTVNITQVPNSFKLIFRRRF